MIRARAHVGRLLALGAALLVVLPARGTADVLVLESGKTAAGVAFRVGEEVRLNTYGCSVPQMTLGVRVYRARDVKRIDPDEDVPWITAELDHVLDGPLPDVARLTALHGLAKRRGYKDLARRLAEEVLARTNDAEALKTVGGPVKWAERRRGDPRLDPVLADELGRALTLERGGERKAAVERLAREKGYAARAEVVERMARSLAEPVGVLEETPLLWRDAETTAGTFTLYVPPDAHPLEPRPLVVALHGGGTITRPDGTQALAGTGRDMVRLLSDGAERLGWFLLCPTALEAPWDTPKNRAFLLAALAEVTGRWNVDLARVHLIGLGEGGDAVWTLGASWSERLATVGASSASAPATAGSLTSARIGVWLQHGEDDKVRPVEPVRRAAERLLDQGADFVYCEIPKEGHGLPSAAERDWYRYVEGRRNPRAKDAWPQPSFERPVTDLERAAFGEPAGAWGVGLDENLPEEALWAALAGGRTTADPAAARLAALRPEGASARAAAIVKDAKAPAAARGWSSWLLGELGDRTAFEVLGDALRASDDPVLRLRFARALRRLAVPDAKEDLRFALLDAGQRHERASFPGGRVPFVVYDRLCRLEAELVEGLALVGTADDVAPDVERALVTGLLKDARPVDARSGPGGDPAESRRALARSIGRAYQKLKVEPTVLEMLSAVLKKDPQALQAAAQGYAEGLPR